MTSGIAILFKLYMSIPRSVVSLEFVALFPHVSVRGKSDKKQIPALRYGMTILYEL